MREVVLRNSGDTILIAGARGTEAADDGTQPPDGDARYPAPQHPAGAPAAGWRLVRSEYGSAGLEVSFTRCFGH